MNAETKRKLNAMLMHDFITAIEAQEANSSMYLPMSFDDRFSISNHKKNNSPYKNNKHKEYNFIYYSIPICIIIINFKNIDLLPKIVINKHKNN